jgi:hypothetical protein
MLVSKKRNLLPSPKKAIMTAGSKIPGHTKQVGIGDMTTSHAVTVATIPATPEIMAVIRATSQVLSPSINWAENRSPYWRHSSTKK